MSKKRVGLCWPTLAKTFLGAFLLRSNFLFWIQYIKTDSWSWFLRPTQRKKKFSSHKRINVYFLWTKTSKMQAIIQYFIERFLYTCTVQCTGLNFSLPFQNFMQDMSGRQNQWSQLRTQDKNCTVCPVHEKSQKQNVLLMNRRCRWAAYWTGWGRRKQTEIELSAQVSYEYFE